MSFWSNDTRVFIVNGFDFFLKGSFSFSGGEVIGELLRISNILEFLLAEPGVVFFVVEVSFPCFWSPDTVVHDEFQWDESIDTGPVGAGGHIRSIVIVDELGPFIEEPGIISVSLSVALFADELWDIISPQSSFNSIISLSSSDFKEPLVGVK